ncbi:MAG: BON domain-containing protein [Burkholderiaceae bacterium]
MAIFAGSVSDARCPTLPLDGSAVELVSVVRPDPACFRKGSYRMKNRKFPSDGAVLRFARCNSRLGIKVVGIALALSFGLAQSADGDVLTNPFHDPVLQVTRGMPFCPVPAEPQYTEAEYRNLAHERSQRGVSCWLAGRCRLSNGYLYDADIIARVKIAVNETARFADTSVWALGQRRRVWLRGCVRTLAQAKDIEAVVRRLDDVEDVQNELMIGTKGVPRYVVKKP